MLAQSGSSRSLCHPRHTEKQETHCCHVLPSALKCHLQINGLVEKPGLPLTFSAFLCGPDFSFLEGTVKPGVDTALIFMCLFSEHTNLSSQRIENRNFTDLLMGTTCSSCPHI